MTMTDLSIVIVSWNVRDLLRDCLSSIREAGKVRVSGSTPEQPSTEVIVVDSASTDGSQAMVRDEFPWVRLIDAESNVGFSRGNNIGLEAAQGSAILLLNPDTRIIGSALSTMLGFLRKHPQVGVVGPRLLNADGTTQSSRRRFPSFWTGVFESTWLEGIAPRGIRKRYYMEDLGEHEVHSVDWVTGAAFMVKRDVIQQVGVFDEGYFMYSEELDWQKRIRDAGWQIMYLPQAEVIHYGGKSSEQVVPLRHIRFQSSKVRYFRKHHGPLVGNAMKAVILANYGWQLSIEALKGLAGHKRSLRQERVRAYWKVIRSGLRTS